MHKKPWHKKGQVLIDEISASSAASGEALIWFLGQSGFVIKLLNKIIYIDAILHEWQDSSGAARLLDPPFLPAHPVDADIFACTHDHSDHLNIETLLPQAKGNKNTLFLVPAPITSKLIAAGIPSERIIAAREDEKIRLGELEIQSVAAAHKEYCTDETGADYALGYIFSSGGVNIYHAGDTFVTGRLLDRLRLAAPINIAILPVNGGDWEREVKGIIGNMSAEDAAKLVRALNIELTIPAHFDFLEGNTAAPARIIDAFSTIAPEHKCHILALGERFIYRLPPR
ncbi:MAG: MBL fold metallo-hydrolase [Termitinemataceae bacterium]|nr:MAG: MBL fold metallo-hydrolase [Termitinemataceae bacterium]